MKLIFYGQVYGTRSQSLAFNSKLMTIRFFEIFTWVLRLVAAVIMLQTLYFKFTADPQSVKLFTLLGMEPWGRIGTGIMELIASVLILIPRTTGIGAVIGLGVMSGAIFFHLTKIGIVFDGDAVLFIYAVLVFISCAILTFIYKESLLQIINVQHKKI